MTWYDRSRDSSLIGDDRRCREPPGVSGVDTENSDNGRKVDVGDVDVSRDDGECRMLALSGPCIILDAR